MARTIAVSGTASGLGLAVRQRLEAAGDRVVGVDLRDAEVIAAADEHGLAMVFTERRHFRH